MRRPQLEYRIPLEEQRPDAGLAAVPLPALVWVALVTVYVLWGSTYLGIRVAVESMPPLLMAGVRFLIAGAILFALRFPQAVRARSVPTLTQWRRTLVIGAALLVGGNGGVAWAEQVVPSGLTALLVATVPLWMALIDRIFYARRLTAPALVGLLAGFGGIALLAAVPHATAVPALGTLVLLVAALSWAAGSLYSRTARLPQDSFLTTGMEMLCGGLLLCVAALLTGEFGRLHIAAITPQSWIAFWYLVVFGAIIGFSAYLWVIRAAPTALVSTYAYVNPVVAVFLGWLVLHEPLTPRILLAGAVIVAGVVLIVSQTSRARLEQVVTRQR